MQFIWIDISDYTLWLLFISIVLISYGLPIVCGPGVQTCEDMVAAYANDADKVLEVTGKSLKRLEIIGKPLTGAPNIDSNTIGNQ